MTTRINAWPTPRSCHTTRSPASIESTPRRSRSSVLHRFGRSRFPSRDPRRRRGSRTGTSTRDSRTSRCWRSPFEALGVALVRGALEIYEAPAQELGHRVEDRGGLLVGEWFAGLVLEPFT